MAWIVVVEVLFALIGVFVGWRWVRSGERRSAADWLIAVLLALFVWLFLSTFALMGTGVIKVGV